MNPSQDPSLHYIKSLLTNDANVLFTACSIVGGSLQDGKYSNENAKESANNFSKFFTNNSNRNLFLNYSKTSATNNSYTSFNFNKELSNNDRGGFLWYKSSSICGQKPRPAGIFFDMKINSNGGMSFKPIRTANSFGPTPENNKSTFTKL